MSGSSNARHLPAAAKRSSGDGGILTPPPPSLWPYWEKSQKKRVLSQNVGTPKWVTQMPVSNAPKRVRHRRNHRVEIYLEHFGLSQIP